MGIKLSCTPRITARDVRLPNDSHQSVIFLVQERYSYLWIILSNLCKRILTLNLDSLSTNNKTNALSHTPRSSMHISTYGLKEFLVPQNFSAVQILPIGSTPQWWQLHLGPNFWFLLPPSLTLSIPPDPKNWNRGENKDFYWLGWKDWETREYSLLPRFPLHRGYLL